MGDRKQPTPWDRQARPNPPPAPPPRRNDAAVAVRVTRVSHIELAADDVILAEFDDYLPSGAAERVCDDLKAIWPEHKIVVMSPHSRLKFISPTAARELLAGVEPDQVKD